MTENSKNKNYPINEKDPMACVREDLYAAERGLPEIGADRASEQDALAKLLDVAERINAEREIEKVLTIAARKIIDIFEAERVFLLEVGPEGNVEFRLAVDFKGETVLQPENEVSHAVIRQVMEERIPVLVADATADSRFAMVSSVRHLQLHSVMAAPLMARGELLGVVYADNRLVRGAFNLGTLNLLGLFASHAAIALRNAQLFHELSAARAELVLSERLKTIGRIATFVVHEVKNPLASIRILMDGLQEHWPDEELRNRVFNMVPKELARLDKSLSQILDYARPTPLIKVPVDLAKLLKSALRTLEPQLQEQQASVIEDFPPDIPAIHADGERLRGVFVNVIKNAIEAMADSDRKELRLAMRRSDKAQVEVVLEDTGPGLPDEMLTTIFEPFRSFKKSGTGIGLALCQKVVREHGGSITAENVPDGGARFRFRLPIEHA